MRVRYRPRRAWPALIALAVGLLAVAVVLTRSSGDSAAGGTVSKPIDPVQQTALAFGERSHWLQPWRAYLDTVPAERLRRAIGIGFNVEPGEAEATAALLGKSGFRRARIEFGWDTMSFEHPGRVRDPGRLRTYLLAMRRHGLRPLLLLNANHGAPGPTQRLKLALKRPAAKGARVVDLTAASARAVVPRRTGFDCPADARGTACQDTPGKAANVLVTGVDGDGRATLSKPLPSDLATGPQQATTLRFEPFGAPRLAGGKRNPRFERTLRGWLRYVGGLTREARRILGGDTFDVEVWNELSFGSDFLYQARYYDPAPAAAGAGDVTAVLKELLSRTVAHLRRPARRLGAIGIADGFSNQSPFPAGSTAPRGLTALAKHPYKGITRFPKDAPPLAGTPLDALGRADFDSKPGPAGAESRADRFIPTYDSFFPEYYLTAIQTEHLVRDISPITTRVGDTAHGRRTHPRGGLPPSVWVTEVNLDPTGADPSNPANAGGGPLARLGARDVEHLQAKAALRYFTAFVNKGVGAIDLYTAKGPTFGLVSPRFFGAVAAGEGRFPGTDSGGETTASVARLARALAGSARLRKTHPLSLLEISDRHDKRQFDGDGTRGHPTLFDRDVLAFFPFQVRPGRYVIATYVMTRNLAKLYRPDGPASDTTRYDLPPEDFRVTIGNVPSGGRLRLTASDPLNGGAVPVKVLSRRGNRVVIEVPATDSPRLLTLTTRKGAG